MFQWIFSIIGMGMLLHDFHVSITEIDYQDQELQCTMRVFSDDLEMRLEEDSGLHLDLGEEHEHALTDSLIANYLQNSFRIELKGKNLDLEYLGKEVDYEMTYLYFYFKCKRAPEELSLSNRVFFDSFEDQSNIVNVRLDGELRSAFLNGAEPSKILSF